MFTAAASQSHMNSSQNLTTSPGSQGTVKTQRLEEDVERSLNSVAHLLSFGTDRQKISRQVRDLLNQNSTIPRVGDDGPLGSVYVIESAVAKIFFPLDKMPSIIRPPKAIHPTLQLNFEKSKEKSKEWEVIDDTPSALITLDDSTPPPNLLRMGEAATKAWKERIVRGNEVLRQLGEKITEIDLDKVYLAAPLERQDAFESMVFTQPWYSVNLEQAVNNLNKTANNTPCLLYAQFNNWRGKPFTKDVIYLILQGMATTLDWMHQYNVVHRDVKASNIFITIKKGRLLAEDQLIGLLGDCEWLKEGFGHDPKGFMHSYPIWDPCAIFNISTPFVDQYGLLVLIARFLGGISLERCVEIRDQAITNLLKKAGFVCPTQNPFEKALFSLCYTSALTLNFILLDCQVELHDLYEIEREKMENNDLTDSQLCFNILREKVEMHKGRFTHAAIVRAMEESMVCVKQEFRQDFVGSMKDIVGFLSKVHKKSSS